MVDLKTTPDVEDFLYLLAQKGVKLAVKGSQLSVTGNLGALDSAEKVQLKANKQAVIDYICELQLRPPAISKITPNGNLSLSFAQQRLWLLDKIDGSSPHYNMPSAMQLSGELNFAALQQTFVCILERHESLRTCFVEDNEGQPYQRVQSSAGFSVGFSDLSDKAGETQALALASRVEQDASLSFDLSVDLMLRVQVLKLSGLEHVLLVTMHHIASDGWSMGILINEFSALYAAFAKGQSNPLVALDIQYADYAHWQRQWLQGQVLDQQLGYWTRQLANLPVVHNLPLDKPRPAMQGFAGEMHFSQISQVDHRALKSVCQDHGATLFMGLHALFCVLLSRYSNETDIVIGSPIANREQVEVASLIGFFVNNLVLRSDLSQNPSFSELLLRNKQMLLDAYAHQQVPFEMIVDKLQPQRSMSHSSLFQVMFDIQNNQEGVLALPDIALSPVEQQQTVAKYELSLSVGESEQGLALSWEYNSDLFEPATIARMAEHFERLLISLVNKPQQKCL
jgi:hypothetical protein